MANEEKTALHHYMPNIKHFGQRLKGSPVDLENIQSYRRQKGLRWALAGAIITCVILRAIPFVVHKQSQENFQPHRIPPKTAEEIFLRLGPNVQSALNSSRTYATRSHPAGSDGDFEEAKEILSVFQSEFGIRAPHDEPIFPAGSKESRDATLKLTGKHAPEKPTAWIDIYYPVLNTPLNHSLSILNDEGLVEWEADLEEDGDPRDPDAHKYRTAVLAWHGLSRGGDAVGELVYANYGTQEDYAELVAAGTNFTGKIVITRYGRLFRGLKIKGAQELGAVGVLIYSDPRDDGYATVSNGFAAYPGGPARNPTSVQRGSVQFISSYPGDPATPGYPAYPDAEREEGSNIPAIPSLPISWGNAQRLLEEVGDIYVEDENGTKKLSGRASQNKIRLVNNVDNKVTPIWNTMATIPGHIKNEVILMGCHRDAWGLGAADPISGTVSLLEVVKGLGQLLKAGWTPLRTLVIASWDAEEYGLVGSTEWGEDFGDWISENVVAYINVDVAAAGSRWNVLGSPSLSHLIKDVASIVNHPTDIGKKLWDARDGEGPYKSFNLTIDPELLKFDEQIKEERATFTTGVPPLGVGDFTTFLQHLGVASVDQGFKTTTSDAAFHYHSVYDSQRWQEVYADPGFYRHVAVAQHLGLMSLRILDSLVLPLNTTQYALELSDYLERVEALVPHNLAGKIDFSALRRAITNVQTASAKLDLEKEAARAAFEKLLKHLPPYPSALLVGAQTLRHNCWSASPRLLQQAKNWIKGVFGVPPTAVTAASWDVAKEFGEDSWEAILGYVYASPEEQALPMWFPSSAKEFIEAAKRLVRSNKRLSAFERGFISEGGIKDREWYKHLGVAPGKWSGYGPTTLPALTEAITIEKNVTLANYEAGRLTELINKLADRITPA